jgi:arginyl-tRNA synthetase
MCYPLISAKKEVISSLKKTLEDLKYDYEFKLEIPSEEMGDYSFPCFQIAKIKKKSPIDVAENIVNNFKSSKYIKSIIQKGGYVNFHLNWELINISTLKILEKRKNKYGYFKGNNIKVIIEHTSANPNGPLHVGRARNPIIGDTLVRIYKAAGFDVESQFYLDDMGKQATILAWGYNDEEVTKEVDNFYNINKFYPGGSKNFSHKPDHQRVGFYQIASNRMREDEKTLLEINELVKRSENGENKAITLIHTAYNPVLDGINESLHRINIHIDDYIPESTFVKDKSVYSVIKKLKDLDYLLKDKKSYYIDLKTYGIHGRNTKFFLTRNDGTTLYATRDIAYHLWKNNQADVLINVLGEDHKLESKQVEIILNLLQAEKIPIPIFYSFVSMPGGKMSTREGRVVYLDDLINECIKRAYIEIKKRREDELSEEKMKKISEIIGIGSLRYNIIKVQAEKDIVFNWSDALNFEGNSAPFIQYSYARASGIISKINIREKINDNHYSLLKHKSEIRLLRNIAEFPLIIEEAYKNFKPHIIANYLFNIASNFNQFYRDCPVLSENNLELKNVRIKLVQSLKIVLKNGLNLLGIDAPDEM